MIRTVVTLTLLFQIQNCHALVPQANNKNQQIIESRRAFCSTAISTGAFLLGQQKGECFSLFKSAPVEEKTYDEFTELLQSNKVQSVSFASDCYSLTCVDDKGRKLSFKNIPDDPNLLAELNQHRVEMTVDAYPFEMKMNSYDAIRFKFGKDDLSDEEKYDYRGYKTKRKVIPERSYIPSNLISN